MARAFKTLSGATRSIPYIAEFKDSYSFVLLNSYSSARSLLELERSAFSNPFIRLYVKFRMYGRVECSASLSEAAGAGTCEVQKAQAWAETERPI